MSKKIVFAIFVMTILALKAHAEPIVTESTNTNTNNSTSTSTSTSTNTNVSTSTSTNTNNSNSRAWNDSNSKTESTIKSPPPSAISPSITTINNDLCVVGTSGAVQTQILGISGGTTTRDMNCERIKLAKNLYDMGMKVAAVAALCQDPRVFDAMMNAGTPCPVDGKIGAEAKAIWESNPERKPTPDSAAIKEDHDKFKAMAAGAAAAALLFAF